MRIPETQAIDELLKQDRPPKYVRTGRTRTVEGEGGKDVQYEVVYRRRGVVGNYNYVLKSIPLSLVQRLEDTHHL